MTTNNDHGGWQPVPHGGDYDAEATAFVQLPEDMDLDGAPLAAPGHGYVPPMILPLTPAAGTDPAATGHWSVPQAAHWPEPGSAQDVAPEQMAEQAYPYDPRATGQWAFTETQGEPAPGQPYQQPHEPYQFPQQHQHPQHPQHPQQTHEQLHQPHEQLHQQPHEQPHQHSAGDLTGQWTIPVAEGEVPEESGEFTTSSLLGPATLPGGAPAPWAVPAQQPEPAGTEAAGAADGGAPAYDGVPVHDPRTPESVPVHDSAPVHDSVQGPDGAQGHDDAPVYDGVPAHGSNQTHGSTQAYGSTQAHDSALDHVNAPADVNSQVHDSTPAEGTPVPAVESVPVSVPLAVHEPEPAAVADLDGGTGPGAQSGPGAGPGAGLDPRQGLRQDPRTEPGQDPRQEPGQEPAPVPETGAELVAEPETQPDPGTGPATEPDPVAASAPVSDPGPARSEHTPASYVLRVNGSDRPVTDAWIGESLLYVLRERLGLAGAKDGCSQGECGACNVQVDGRLVASCLVPAATAAGSEVRTVEGLAVNGEPSDVQRALADCGAVQCGFCIPGMAMTVHDLLEGNHAPTELETRQALCGNLCRCSGYRGVLDAVGEVVAARAAAATATEEARIPHQAPPGAGGAQPSHPQQQHDGGMA
ncbi:2Fe-2S iron-sulfur cluster-binding protein [Streptomyces sp. NBC_01014]|uniref:(2Fe-2S)-binding protein n=1 Tax=Streptomyces sp. NBC_01014 TaxID=2903719 RepID=UPI00386BBBE2|nr:2Fe-2S iron-sulfur cluster-binding protein [Streptomyces sp. NBC_01014]